MYLCVMKLRGIFFFFAFSIQRYQPEASMIKQNSLVANKTDIIQSHEGCL